MNLINIFRKNILYFFLSLPFVIVLYELLMTITLGNRGYAVLLLGQLVTVPLLLLILNFILANDIVIQSVAVLVLLGLLAAIIYGGWLAVRK
jgi:hypothetical protein